MIRIWVTWLLAGLILACDPQSSQSCRMDTEYHVAHLEGRIRAMTLVSIADNRLLLTWATDRGLWTTTLSLEGIPHPQRQAGLVVDEENTADALKAFWADVFVQHPVVRNLDSLVLADGRVVQCGIADTHSESGDVFAVIMTPETGRTEAVIPLGNGADQEITCAAANAGFQVAWPERDAAAVILLTVDEEGRIQRTQRLAGGNGVRLVNRQSGGNLLIRSRPAKDHRDLVVSILDEDSSVGSPVRIDRHRTDNPDPGVAVSKDTIGLLFRDLREGDRIAGFYFTTLAPNGSPQFSPVRISRADGPGGPVLAIGDGVFFSAAVRSFQKNYLIGFNHFDEHGRKRGGEFQVYADNRDFVRTAIHRTPDGVILTYAEERGHRPRIRSAVVTCR